MKKFIVFILAILYLITTSGVVVTIHYCMGKFSSAELGNAKIHFCEKCGMKESEKQTGCCHSENKIYKVDDSHNYVKVSSGFSKTVIALPARIIRVEEPPVKLAEVLALQYHSPPDNRSTSVYLYNNVFRI